jgi:hypothetical protein
LAGKPEGKRPLGRPRRKWVDNIKMELVEIGLGGVDWNGQAQGWDMWRVLVNAVMSLSGSVKCCGPLQRLHNWWVPV